MWKITWKTVCKYLVRLLSLCCFVAAIILVSEATLLTAQWSLVLAIAGFILLAVTTGKRQVTQVNTCPKGGVCHLIRYKNLRDERAYMCLKCGRQESLPAQPNAQDSFEGRGAL